MSERTSGKTNLVRSGRLGLIVALGMMLLNTACSTPAVPEENVETTYNSTLNSYQNCLARNYPTDQGMACDTVMVGQAQSYQSYTGGSAAGGTQNYMNYKAYSEYLAQQDEATLKDLQAQWDSINPAATSNH